MKPFVILMLSFSVLHAQKSKDAFSQMVNEHLSFTVPVINVDDVQQMNRGEVILLDAREPEEYKVSHIRGAINIGYDHFDQSIMQSIPKNKKIVVYCSIGYRSEKIGEQLLKMGYKNVYNLYGSLFAWVNRGYAIVDNNGRPTFNVHGYNASWAQWITNKKYKKVY